MGLRPWHEKVSLFHCHIPATKGIRALGQS